MSGGGEGGRGSMIWMDIEEVIASTLVVFATWFLRA